MSYYMGDYYRGDPGIGSFFGGLIKKVAGVASSFIPGVGPIISKGISMLPTGGAAAAAKITAAAGRAAGAVSTAIVKHPALSAAGAAGALGSMAAAGAAIESMRMGAAAHGGKHVLKRCGTLLKSGRPAKCHRSMNVCNPRALRKAIRRTRGFAKLAMKTIHIVHPKKKGRFGGFKTRRRK